MSARERLVELMSTAPVDRVEQGLAIVAFRAEVLEQVADRIVLDRDGTLPSGGRGAYRRGMTRAVAIIQGQITGGAR